jgi:hypothetical protein
MSLEESQALRTKISKNIKSIRKRRNLSLTVYVQAEVRDSFEIARKWAFERGLTKTDSNWAFAKFALLNTIQIVLNQIAQERNAPPEQPQEVEVQEEPIIA